MATLLENNDQLWTLACTIDSTLSNLLKSDLEVLDIADVLSDIANEIIERTGSCAEGTKVNSKYDKGDVDALLVSGKIFLDESLFDYLVDDPAHFKILVKGEHETYFTTNDTVNGFVLANTLRAMNEKHFLMHRLLIEVMSLPEQNRHRFVYPHSSGVGVEKRTISNGTGMSSNDIPIDLKDILKFNRPEACRFLLEKFSNLLTKSSDQDYIVLGDFMRSNMQWVKKYSQEVISKSFQGTIDGAVLEQSSDFVPAYRIKSGMWPRVAEDWKCRYRTWPAKAVVESILDAGCHVVAKSPPHMVDDAKFVGDGPDVYFRLSFSVSEVMLAKCMNDVQLNCWKILKAYQKGFLDTSPKVLSSYHWKNVVFWLCESESESFWVGENLLFAVKRSIEMMLECLRCRQLPQYFCPTMNLLRHCDPVTMDIVNHKLQHIFAEPVTYLGHFLDNPPKAKLCSVDTDEIPVRSLNKLVETGHTSFSELVSDLVEKEDVEKVYGSGKKMLDLIVNLSKEQSLERAKSSTPEKRELIRNVADGTTKFIERIGSNPPTDFKTKGDYTSFLKTEGKKFAKEIGKAFVSNVLSTNSEEDLALD